MKVKIGNKTFEVSKEALESNPEEVTIEFNGTLRTSEEDASFIDNHKKDARKEGVEIAVKKYRETYGFEGRTIDKLIEAVASKTLEEASIEPTEQLKKMKQTLTDKEEALQKALETVKSKDSEFVAFKNQTKLNNQLNSLIPDNTILPKDDVKLILTNKLNFDFDEVGNVVALDSQGNVLKDKTTANNLTLQQVTENFFKDNQQYLKGNEGGSGAGDSGGNGGKKTLDDFIKEQVENNIAINSPDFNKNLQAQMEANLIEV